MTIAVARAQDLYVGHYRREGNAVTPTAPEDAMTPGELATFWAKTKNAVLLGPAVGEYRAQLEGLGIPPDHILEAGAVPSAVHLGGLTHLGKGFDAQALFALEPHYIRGSGAERNPKFPPLPGPVPTARLKED